MKKAKWIIYFFLVFKGNVFCQLKTLPNSFVLQGDFDKSKTSFYENSILAASMETYRLKESDVVLKFKDGFECVMYSAKSLFLKGISIEVNNYKDSFPKDYILPIFTIYSNGQLGAETPRNPSYKY
jgi:hypothetical protein